MKNTKRITTLLICLSLSLSLFCGCSTTEAATLPLGESGEQSFDNSAPEIHMTNAMDSSLGMDIEGKVMAMKDVGVRAYPSEDAPENRTLLYQLVKVHAVVHSEEYSSDDRWALVSFSCFDSEHDNIGWVKLTEIEQYSIDNMELLRYPVSLAEGCVDLDTGEAISWDDVSVYYEDDCAVVEWEGGNRHRVDKEYIVYPEP